MEITHWIFVAHTILDSSTYYAYDSKTNTYVQPVYSQRLLHRFVQASAEQLQKIKLQTDIQLERRGTRAAGTSLFELAEIGAKETPLAPAILSHVLEQLSMQKELVGSCWFYRIFLSSVSRIPVLLAVDDFQSLFCPSRYRDAHFKPIASYHLSVARLLLEYAGGKRAFVSCLFLILMFVACDLCCGHHTSLFCSRMVLYSARFQRQTLNGTLPLNSRKRWVSSPNTHPMFSFLAQRV